MLPIVLHLQDVRAAAATCMPKTQQSRQLLVQSLLDESPTVRDAAAQQLTLHYPAIVDLSLSERCSVIRAASEASAPALNEMVATWVSSCGGVEELLEPHSPSSLQHPGPLAGVFEAAMADRDDADLQAVSKALVTVSYIEPYENEGTLCIMA